MNILFLEGYYGGSHRAFADGWRARSRHAIRILGLPARKWKWRMQTGAWVLAAEALAESPRPDLIFATDMIDLAHFLGLTRRQFADTPALLYFHENQYSYPPQVEGGSDFAWGVINSASALAADGLVFNSEFNRRDFFRCWRRGNRVMPDARLDETRLDALEAAAHVVPVGVDFESLDRHAPHGAPRGQTAPEGRSDQSQPPLILWNHRWEHDKQPEAFFDALREVKRRGKRFRLAVCGECFASRPACFDRARREFADEIEIFGYLEDAVVSTAIQEFLGVSVIEALWCGCYPLLPDRLNYPHLLPEGQHADHLCATDGELAQRLATYLDAPRPYAPRQAFLEPYAWPQVARKLDDLVDGCK